MDFPERIEKYLKSEFSEQSSSLSNEEFQEEIKNGISRAQIYGFESEADIVRFIDLQWRMGKDFDAGDKHPGAKGILTDSSIAPSLKIQLLRDSYAMHLAQQAGKAL